MPIIEYGFEGTPHGDSHTPKRRTVVTIGSFDGVHCGHRVLLEHLKAMAHRLDAESVVVTFDPHPRIAMGRDDGMQLLTTIEERARLIAEACIDRMVVARFDEAFRSQPYEQFVRESLVERLGMVGMIVGYNHRLGRGSEGNFNTLQPLAAECGFELECVAQHTDEGGKISSTIVRDTIAKGDMSRARELLGAGYMLSLSMINGRGLVADDHKMLPPMGCYICDIERDNTITRTEVVVEGREVTASLPVDGLVTITF